MDDIYVCVCACVHTCACMCAFACTFMHAFMLKAIRLSKAMDNYRLEGALNRIHFQFELRRHSYPCIGRPSSVVM